MYKRYKTPTATPEPNRREQLINNLTMLVHAETGILLQEATNRAHRTLAKKGKLHHMDQYRQQARERLEREDHRKLDNYSEETLRLMFEIFSINGIHRLLAEAPEEDGDVFIRERLTFNIDTGLTQSGTHIVFRAARTALGVEDMSRVPYTDRGGIAGVLMVAAESAKVEASRGTNEAPDHRNHMTPEVASMVMHDPDITNGIVSCIEDQQKTVRELGIDTLRQYIAA